MIRDLIVVGCRIVIAVAATIADTVQPPRREPIPVDDHLAAEAEFRGWHMASAD